jgi:hypothetical protein
MLQSRDDSFIHQRLYSPLFGPGRILSFVILYTMISSSQGLYLYTGQHKHKMNAHTDIHVSSGIRTQGPNVWAGAQTARPLRSAASWRCVTRTNSLIQAVTKEGPEEKQRMSTPPWQF